MHSATADEIKNAIKHVEKTIEAMEKDNIEITMESLRAESRKYQGLINAGWDSIESYRERVEKNNETLTDRLQRYFGKSNFAELSTIEKAEFLKRYYAETKKNAKNLTYYNDLKNLDLRGPQERKKAIETYIVTDFAKLVALSTAEERELLYGAIKDLNVSTNGKYKALESVFSAFSSIEECQEFADKNCTAEAMHDMIKDAKPEEAETARKIVRIQVRHQSESKAIENGQKQVEIAKAFFEKNSEKINRITEKLESNIPLTKEEEILYHEYLNFEIGRRGFYEGIMSSETMTSIDSQVNVLEHLNAGTMQIAQFAGEGFYRNVLQGTADYIQNCANELTMTVSQARAMMDATTRGNFSTVITDNQNGTRTALNTNTVVDSEAAKQIYSALEKYDGKYTVPQLNEVIENVVNSKALNPEKTVVTTAQSSDGAQKPVKAEKTESTETAKGSLGFATKPIDQKITLNSINTKIQNLANASKEVKEENVVEEKTVYSPVISEVALAVRENGVEGLKAYVKENGTQKTILEVLNDGESVPSYIKDVVTTWFEKSNKQLEILSRASISAIKELLPVTDEKVLLNNKGKTFTNYYATKLFNDKAKEVEKESKKRNYAW